MFVVVFAMLCIPCILFVVCEIYTEIVQFLGREFARLVHHSSVDLFLRDVLNLVLVNFMVLSILRLFLIIHAGLSLSFHSKTVLAALTDRK